MIHPSATLIRPGDLFGLLTILELAETGYIRSDALFATSPDGIIVELNSPPRKSRRGGSRNGGSRERSGSGGSRGSSCSTERGERKEGRERRRSERGSERGSERSRSSSTCSNISAPSPTSRKSTTSTSTSFTTTKHSPSSPSFTHKTTTTTTSSPASTPTPSNPKKSSPPPPGGPKSAPKSEITEFKKAPTKTFTYHSPSTHLSTTINPSNPSSVPAAVATEAISALIGKLDDILAAKRCVVAAPLSVAVAGF